MNRIGLDFQQPGEGLIRKKKKTFIELNSFWLGDKRAL